MKLAAPLVAFCLLVPAATGVGAEDGLEREADVLAFVGEHQPELAKLLQALKPMNAKEYRKAIRDLAPARDRLVELQKRNAPRYPLLLDAWKARTRVELLSARLAGEPSSEAEAKLREAIADGLDVEIRLQRFEIEQAEAAARNHRRNLERLESDRDATLEARYRAALPRKKIQRAKKGAEGNAAPVPSAKAPAPGGNRR
ncbi:hypothetical protein TA3x_000789 [Tundrisphaera sp. TA3]|uniref:hypothetical protein n=1 Tax=Tundrisphaera sp. TA3 TaxID=3435775 RepID=UPI003EB95D82